MDQAVAVATPTPGSVSNVNGQPCPKAFSEDYPLYATCACGGKIRCADSTADWCHVRDYRATCPQGPS